MNGTPEGPSVLAERLHLATGFLASERDWVVRRLGALGSRLRSFPDTEIDLEISLKDRHGTGRRVTLECWISRTPRPHLVSTSTAKELAVALNEVRDDLTRQLVAQGVAAVELHGNLGQPSMEHKAYPHRSGRTARAGASGTVVTLMTDTQVADVRDLTSKAGITATVTRLRPGHPLLTQLAPGERTYTAPSAKPAPNTRSDRGARPAGANPQRARSTRTPRRPTASNTQPTAEPKTGGIAAFSAGTRTGRRR